MATERGNTPPPTQVFSHHSSPVKKGAFYAGNKLEQVQRYGYKKENHRKPNFEDADDLLKFLGTPTTLDELPDVRFEAEVPRSMFFAKVNSMAKTINDKLHLEDLDLVVFKDTENKPLRGHPTDTNCRPDITAAFEEDFEDNDTTFWSHIRMAGEYASKGSSRGDQETKAISYLHYLLLARPDFYVAQGMLGSEKSMMFLVGIGGSGVKSLELPWNHAKLSRLLYAFIYRIYKPGDFADPAYERGLIVNGRPTWTINLDVESQVGGVKRRIPCPNFISLHATSPFGTRTHVFATSGEGVDVDGKTVTVIKEQLCQIGNRFDEHEILEQIHNPKRIPGVVEAVYYICIELPSQLDNVGRVKHRHGLRQLGSPFASIPTVKEMLQVAFDIVEVLRFLRTDRHILHRDISVGNVMYAPTNEDEQDTATSTQDDEVLFFCEYFLSDSPRHPPTTSVLLVDFNHAEDLTKKKDGDCKRVERTGTAVFMARAVELGRPTDIPYRDLSRYLAPIPSASDRYAKHYHDTRLKRFPPKQLEPFPDSPAMPRTTWRHELDHDIESVFWLMLYRTMTAQPESAGPAEAQDIEASAWTSLMGSVTARQGLLKSARDLDIAEGTFHSDFRPLDELFSNLADILLSIDRHWLEESEKRSDPEYFAEAFQRLILQFIINHKEASFMVQKIDSRTRQAPKQVQPVPQSSTTSQRSHAESLRKRSASASAEQSKSKRHRDTVKNETDESRDSED